MTDILQRPPYRSMSDLLVTYVGELIETPVAQKARAAANIPDAPVVIPAITYDAPIEIKKGGTYSNLNIRSTDPNTPCITVSTYDPVEITGCTLVHVGKAGIWCNGGVKINVHHNTIIGDTPAGGAQYGKAFYSYHPQTVIFKNNTVEHSGGILIDHRDENTKSVYIGYNIIRNTDKRRADLSLGDQHSNAIQFNTVPGIVGEICYNFIENLPGESRVEDNINIYNSGGTAASPFLIHDNFIKGAYPWPLTADFTGSGITVDGDPGTNTFDTVSQYINIYNNQIISTCNAAMNIAAGHDVHFTGNTAISSGYLPDGTKCTKYWSGACIWNASHVPDNVFVNNSTTGNTIGYVSWGQNANGTDRQDTGTVAGEKINILPADNIHLPNPITLDMEKAELVKWQTKTAGLAIGNAIGATAVTPDVSIKVGQPATGTIEPTSNGKPGTYQVGTVKVSTSDAKVFTVTLDPLDEKIIHVTPVAAGTATLTVSLQNKKGVTLTKTKTIEVAGVLVVPEDMDATDFNVTFKI